MAKLVCLFLLSIGWVAAQRVDGTVVDSATGNGIAAVTVEIVPSSSADGRARMIDTFEGKASYTATTDTQGRFRIDNVRDGSYTIRYTADGYQDQAAAPTREPVAPWFEVRAGNPVQLTGRMIHMAWISGRLVDDKGEGLGHARIDLSSSNLMLSLDANGEGRFSLPITPGIDYTLTAVPQLGWKPPEPESGTGRVLGWAKTYYPGVANREAAAKIKIPPGGELSSIEMKMVALPVHAVRGVILNPDGKPAAKVAITIGYEASTPVLKVESKADGLFEFPAVVDGPWRFGAEMDRDDLKLRAAQWIEVTGRDLDGVKLHLDAPFAVALRVVMERPEGWKAPRLPTVRLTRAGRGDGPFFEPPLPVRTQPDGSLRLDPVYPGVYRFSALVAATPPGYYLDAVRLGETELAAPDVPLSSGAAALTMVYKTGGGSVRGTVEKCALGGVVLAPQDPALRWPTAVHVARCDANDRYEVQAVRPGEYYAQAFQPNGSAQLWEPHFDEGRVTQATRITVRAGESSSVDLKVIGR